MTYYLQVAQQKMEIRGDGICQTGYYYAMARNLLYPDADKLETPEQRREYQQKINKLHGTIEHLVLRIYVALSSGGRLEMRHPAENERWYVNLVHNDGTTENLKPFRRRKRAEAFIANMYLYVNTPLTNP